MNETRVYMLDGMKLCVPLRFDIHFGKTIEDYREWIENEVYTPAGHRIMFSGTDACSFAEEATPGGCPDCGSCRFYKRAGEHTRIGACMHEDKQVKTDA